MATHNQHNQRQQSRWKRMPPRDEHGQLRVTYEFRPARSVLDRERFDDLARMLYQRWVLEPAPWENPALTAVELPAPFPVSASPPLPPVGAHHV